MLDSFGRNIHYLRISLTDRCNLRCVYCMPAGQISYLPEDAHLTFDEILRTVRICAELGFDRIRLTGGEPLLYHDLARLVAEIKQISGIRHVMLTTNAVLLEDQLPTLVAAGLDGVNISLDTLDRAQFTAITRRDKLSSVFAGFHAALRYPNLTVKLNCVPMPENADQLIPLATLAKNHDIAIRFIELMPIGLGTSLPLRTEASVLACLESAFGPAVPIQWDGGAGPCHYVSFPGFQGRIGFVSAMTHQFCSECNRIRLTANGQLKACLQYGKGQDLRCLLRSGTDDQAIRSAICSVITEKPACHHFSSGAMVGDEFRSMNAIGG